jgi:hypothetical protein
LPHPEQAYDFIVVGSGSAGAIIAARNELDSAKYIYLQHCNSTFQNILSTRKIEKYTDTLWKCEKIETGFFER